MIDVHSHIIPGIDDGSKSIEMTLEMLKMAERANTKKIIATPHYYKGYFTTSYKDIKNHINTLEELVKENDINIDIYQGQEIYFFNNILNDYEEGLIGTINDSRYMLIEFPMHDFDKEIMDGLYELQIRGITPVIAHPERYMYFMKKPSEINKLIDEGYLFQLNGGSITGLFGKNIKKNAELFLKNGIYSFLGSDAHTDRRRNPSLTESADEIKKLVGEHIIEELNSNGEKLINNEEILFQGERIKEKKGLFSIFRK